MTRVPGSALRKLRPAGAAVAFALVYFLTAELTRALIPEPGIAVLWPASGVYLGAMLVAPRQSWRIMTVGAGLGSFAAYLHGGSTLELSIAFAVPSSAEGLLGALLVERIAGHRLELRSMRDLIALVIGGAVVANAVVAISAAAVAARTFDVSFAESWLRWWSADALGMIAIAPIIVARLRLEGDRLAGPQLRELGVMAAGVACGAAFAFTSEPAGPATLVGGAIAFPFLLWAGWRRGPRAAAVGGLALALVVAHIAEQIYLAQGFLAVLLLGTLAFAVAAGERERAREDLDRVSEELERGRLAVDHKTHQLEGRSERLERATRRIAQLTGQLAARSRQLSKVENELVAARREADERESALAAARRETEERESALVAVRREAGERDSALVAVRRESDERATALATAQREIQRREGELGTIRRQLDERDRELAADRERAQRELDEKAQVVARLHSDLDRSREEVSRARAAVAGLRDELYRANTEGRAAAEELSRVRADAGVLQGDLRRARSDNDALKTEVARTRQELEALRAGHADALDVRARAERELEAARSELSEAAAGRERAERELELVAGRIDGLHDQLRRARLDHTQSEQALEHARNRFAEQRAELERALEEATRTAPQAEVTRPGFARHAEMSARYDDRGICLHASDGFCKLLGYESRELVGRPGAELLHPDDRPRLARARATKTETTFRGRLRRRSGEYETVDVTLEPVLAWRGDRLVEIRTTVRELSSENGGRPAEQGTVRV